jgi:hypothetical protein
VSQIFTKDDYIIENPFEFQKKNKDKIIDKKKKKEQKKTNQAIHEDKNGEEDKI